ncbi:MAG: hypothetical protein ACR2OH_14355 [Microthrixaceae bacterium]
MKRFLAVIAAVAMVGLAILLRGLIDDGGSGGDGGSSNAGDAGADGNLTLVCGPELLPACNDLEADLDDVTVMSESEADTAARLAEGTLDLDGATAWLAAGPWPEIAAAEGLDMPEMADSDVLANSPAVIVARSDRMEAINSACGSANWSCIGDAAGGEWTDLGGESTWGRIEVGLPEPDSGAGTVAVNQAVASRVGTPEFATNDLDGPDVEGWFDSLAQQSKDNATSTSPLTQFLRVPGSLGVVGALEAETIQQLESAAVAEELTTTVPEPTSVAEVRLWAGDEDQVAAILERFGETALVEALTANGWRGGSPDATGLPAAGVMSAVNTRWEQA